MRCPHCNKNIQDHLIETAERNAESYGSNTFVFECKKCHKKYTIHFHVQITKDKPYQVPDKTDTSF